MARAPLKGRVTEVIERVAKKVSKYHTKQGREIPDPLPLEPPLGYKRSPTLAEQIKAMVRGAQLAEDARRQGFETFEEADDFELDEEFDPGSPYEEHFEPEVDDREDVLSRAVAKGMEEYNKRMDEKKKKKEPEEKVEPEVTPPAGEGGA